MNKKILAVFGILAIVMVGCACATDSDDSLDSNAVTISGVNFTIPEGFTEDVDDAIVNESDSDDGNNYVTNGKSYSDDDGNLLLITVSEYEQNITDDLVDDIGDEKTIGNVTGYFDDMGFLSLFSYVQDGKVVVLTATEENLIEEALS
jgi:hypothetical protein